MSGKTNIHEASVLNVLRGTSLTGISPFVGLFTAAPSDAGGGTEVSGGSYARQAPTFAVPAGTPRAIASNADVTFPTASADWGTITHFGIFDAVSAGNLLYWAAVTVTKTVLNGDTAKILSGALTVTED